MVFNTKNPIEIAMYTNNFIRENSFFFSVLTIEMKQILTKNARNDDVLVIMKEIEILCRSVDPSGHTNAYWRQ